MNRLELVQRAIHRAGLETRPTVDVANKVIEALRCESSAGDAAAERSLAWVAGLSAALAAPAAVVLVVAWTGLGNPVAELFYSMAWGIL